MNYSFHKSFTLIELLVSIAISIVTAAAIYFSLNTALESWGYSKDQLALQKVLNDVMETIASGTVSSYGVRDSLEVIAAGANRLEFVPPWVDDTHTARRQESVYVLTRRLKPGSSVPIAEVKLPEVQDYQLVQVKMLESEDSKFSRLQLGVKTVEGSQLKFTYHPDAVANPDVVKSIWWDPDDKHVYSQYVDGREVISENSFGVEIIDMAMRYYDNANNVITDFQWVEIGDLNLITGVEIFIKAKLGQYTKDLISFVNLRNSPLRAGYLPLEEGMRLPIPDSYEIHTLMLSNFSGVQNGDVLALEATPQYGKSWRIEIEFSQAGLLKPKLEKYTVEYPSGNVVYTEYPRTGLDVGLNLLALDAGGLYDYDKETDIDIRDLVLVEGEVILEVDEMNIEGVGLFIRP
ncbi:MAG: type II secretion system protein [Candidatus Omnitrophota bacterium]|nr:MAG: type II secretion system protein [Candidatus Omnitrophota bacterium]